MAVNERHYNFVQNWLADRVDLESRRSTFQEEPKTWSVLFELDNLRLAPIICDHLERREK